MGQTNYEIVAVPAARHIKFELPLATGAAARWSSGQTSALDEKVVGQNLDLPVAFFHRTRKNRSVKAMDTTGNTQTNYQHKALLAIKGVLIV